MPRGTGSGAGGARTAVRGGSSRDDDAVSSPSEGEPDDEDVICRVPPAMMPANGNAAPAGAGTGGGGSSRGITSDPLPKRARTIPPPPPPSMGGGGDASSPWRWDIDVLMADGATAVDGAVREVFFGGGEDAAGGGAGVGGEDASALQKEILDAQLGDDVDKMQLLSLASGRGSLSGVRGKVLYDERAAVEKLQVLASPSCACAPRRSLPASTALQEHISKFGNVCLYSSRLSLSLAGPEVSYTPYLF